MVVGPVAAQAIQAAKPLMQEVLDGGLRVERESCRQLELIHETANEKLLRAHGSPLFSIHGRGDGSGFALRLFSLLGHAQHR